MGNSFIHLTNVAIQKTGETYNSETGGKWGLRELKLYLLSRHGAAAVDDLFHAIQMVGVGVGWEGQRDRDRERREIYKTKPTFNSNHTPTATTRFASAHFSQCSP